MINKIHEVLSILAELNESAVEMLIQESYEDAADYLLKAEYVITMYSPTNNSTNHKHSIEDTYICTIYYNLACVCQKVGKLDEWVKYLEKGIKALEEYYKKNGSDIAINSDSAKLINNNNIKYTRAAQYNDSLMKYRYLTKFNLQLCAVLSQLSE